jgi:mono/diheme cytochrome c family protein
MAAALWVGSVSAPTVAARGQESRRTIWDGVFSDAQAMRGEGGYTRSCAKCHAADLLGTGNAPALVGEPFLGRFDRSTVDDVVQIVRQTMPQEAPDSLGPDAYVDIVTYLFKVNGSPAGSAELSADRAVLKQVFVSAKEERR